MNDAQAPESPSPKKRKLPIPILILVVVLVVGGFFGVRYFLYNSSHVTTDDAQVTIDVVPVNAQVQGTIDRVLAVENRPVKKGDILVELDPRTYQADVDQAKANLAVALANLKSAGAELAVTTQTGQAQVAQAQGGVVAGGSAIGAAEANADKAQSSIHTASATFAAAQAQALAADQSVQVQIANRDGLVRQLGSFQAAVTSAEATVRVAEANLVDAEATSANAQRDARRYRALARQGAVAVSIAEARETAATTTQAAVKAAQDQVSAAQAMLDQRKADLAAAKQQLKGASSVIASARAAAQAAHESATAAKTRVGQARSDAAAAQQGIVAAQAQHSQALGILQEAQALPRKITASEAARQQARAKVDQARAALATTEISLARTKIRASVDGIVTKKSAEVGQQVAPGQPLMSIIQDEQPWIVANFKETQLADVAVGQAVDIEVDKVPGHTFHGHVDSIAPGTGATFALLPPDNATGNFTKVVQRIPVKITLDPGQPKLDKLLAGASVSVAIILK